MTHKSHAQTGPYLVVVHINVGQGDSTLVISPTGEHVLIDAGDLGKGRLIAPVLDRFGIKKLTHIIITHYHSDHYAGLFGLTEYISPSTVIYSRSPCLFSAESKELCRIEAKEHDTKNKRPDLLTKTGRPSRFRRFLELPGKHQAITETDKFLSLGDASIRFVAVNADVFGVDKQPAPVQNSVFGENILSAAMLLKYQGFDYLIAGDLTAYSDNRVSFEKRLGEAVGDVDVYRVSHHGSDSSSSEEFLNLIRPEVAVISVGNGGRNRKLGWYHPSRSVLDRFKSLYDAGITKKVFLTNKGETQGGLTNQDRDSLVSVGPEHVIIYVDKKYYTINGMMLPFDEQS